MKLAIEEVRFSYGQTPVLKGVTIEEVAPGKITAIMGPNAAGRTTYFKCIAGLLKPQAFIRLDGVDLREYSREDITRQMSYLPPESPVNAVPTVFEVILLARKHTRSWRVSEEDLRAVARVLDDLDIEELSTRFLNELSGGRKQVVSIPQSLVRHPQISLMDEPTSSLDLQHQLEVLDLIIQVTVKRGITTLISVHDLNLSAKYAARFLVMHQGEVYASGDAEQVLTADLLRDVCGVFANVHTTSAGIPQITPTGSIRTRRSYSVPVPLGDD